MGFYINTAIKLAIGFLCLIIYINLAGRAQMAPNSGVDQIGNYVLGGIIGGVIYNPAVSILEMVIIIAIWAVLVLTTTRIKAGNRKVKSLIDGMSILVFHDGEIKTNNLRQGKVTTRDFIAKMHMAGIKRLDELQSVWLETNGQYTILKKGEPPFPIAYIEDGSIVQESLSDYHHNEDWLMEQIKAHGADSVSQVAYAEWVEAEGGQSGEMHVYCYD